MANTRFQPDADDDLAAQRWRRLLILLGVLLIPALVLYWPGCKQYPEVTSKEALSLMKLLYAACNTQDTARLTRVEQGVAKAVREGKMSDREQEAFRRVIDLARGGDWKGAEKASFRFAQDQIR